MLLLLLTVTSITACLILKRKGLNLSTNIEYSNSETRVGNHREANIVTNVNIAYKSVQQTVPINYAELEVMYSTAESLQSMESMEENVAYESSNAAIKQISLRSNVAYYKSERKLSEENDYDHIDDQYDYI